MGKSRQLFLSFLFVLLFFATACDQGGGEEGVEGFQPDEGGAEPDDAGVASQPTTYYIRVDGGSPEQCTGAADAPYPGSGSSQPCAWDHPFRALPPEGPIRIAGGDTLIIGPGSYMMGYGAPGAELCEPDYPWDCFMSPVPSGAAGKPTRILGKGWHQDCSEAPELWGTERAIQVLNLEGSSHVEVACLELTDHAGCAEDHTGGMACKRDSYPFGPWAEAGVYAADSSDVSLRQMNIHGFAVNGIFAGRLRDWTVEDVRIAANGWSGWDGDIEGDDGNTGTIALRRVTVAWNGCVETFPGEAPNGCWGQSAGGYGDGLGTGETGGHWIIEDSAFRHNSSDGLDLLYTRREGSQVTVRRTIAAGNAGDQIKTTGPTIIENVIAISNCGFFTGKPFTHEVDFCRSGGSGIALEPRTGDQITVVNSTVTGQGDCLIISVCAEGSACDGSERIVLRNNIFTGNPEFQGGGDQTCMTWTDLGHDPFTFEHDIITNLKAMPEPCPSGSFCGVDPGVANGDIDEFDAHLTEGSLGIDAGLAEGAPPDDFSGRSRDGKPDIGAYEH